MTEFLIGILSLIIIIFFFILCSNIKKIRSFLENHFMYQDGPYFRNQFYTLLACGRKEEAQQVLIKSIVKTISKLRLQGYNFKDDNFLKPFAQYIADCDLKVDIKTLKLGFLTEFEFKKYLKEQETTSNTNTDIKQL